MDSLGHMSKGILSDLTLKLEINTYNELMRAAHVIERLFMNYHTQLIVGSEAKDCQHVCYNLVSRFGSVFKQVFTLLLLPLRVVQLPLYCPSMIVEKYFALPR